MKRTIANIGLLFIAQIFSYVIPIVEIPILARALGAEGYGKVVTVQSIALLASLFMEYGFGISAVRQIALVKDDKRLIAKIYGDVLSAKLMIAIVVGLLMGFICIVSGIVANLSFLVYGILYFLAFGLSPIWLFQGVERLTGVLSVEMVIRCSGVLVLFIWVKDEKDVELALGIMAFFALLNTIVSSFMSLGYINKTRLSVCGGWGQIKNSYQVFMYKSANNILMSSGPALISIMGGAQALASYVPAEKIVKGLVGIAVPLLTGLLPFISRSFRVAKRPPIFLSVFVSSCLTLLGVVFAIVITIAGKDIVMFALGEGFESAVDILKLFVWVVPLRMANHSLGLVFLIPMNKDRLVGILALISSLVAVLSVIVLTMVYGARGAAAGFILAESLFFIFLVSAVYAACSKRCFGQARAECELAVTMISILTPTYNRAYTLQRLFESLIAQSDQCFEWIVVDDGSTDDTTQLLARMAKSSNLNMKVVPQPNSGKHVAINTGLAIAKADWIFIVDSDDCLTTDAVKKVSRFIQECDSDDVLGVSYRRAFLDLTPLGVNIPMERGNISFMHPTQAAQLYKGDLAYIFRRSALLARPFPVFTNEKFVPELLVWNKIGDDGRIAYHHREVIYLCEYLLDGLSANFHSCLRRNPKAFKVFYQQQFFRERSLLRKLKCAIRFSQCLYFSMTRG